MNRYTRSQFVYSTYGKPCLISGHASLIVPVQASLVTQGLTLTAVALAASGNSITIAFTGGGTAGAEVVTVVGNAISVQIQSGVSTVTQVRTAMQAAAACTALVTTTGTSGAAVSTAAALNLAGGIDSVSGNGNFGSLLSSIARTGVGEYTFTLADSYNAIQGIHFDLLAATAVDLVPQIKSASASGKTIVVRLLAGATPTELAAPVAINMTAILNASSV